MRDGNHKTDPQIVILRPSWLNYLKNFLWASVPIVGAVICLDDLEAVSIVLLPIAFIVLLAAVLKRKSLKFTITSDTVNSRGGIVRRSESEVRIIDIREIGIKQGIFQRVFNIGNVFFASAATGGIEVTFEGVKDPVGIKSRVNGLRQALVVADKKRCPHCHYAFEQNSEYP